MKKHSGSKYLRSIYGWNDKGEYALLGKVDVYCVHEAFKVNCPARQHASKKILCSGIRGKGDVRQDLEEAGDAVGRAIEMERARCSENDNQEIMHISV